jgi:FAD binding domain
MSMLVPRELTGSDADHGLATDRPSPRLEHIQAVLDRLAPEPTVARNLRWSSVFRISHRLVDRYSVGRVFLCGDAPHIHPPSGAQGMNTGIQDAYNLAWKLALAVKGIAASGLLESYHAERHPIGEEVVGRTVRHAKEGFEADPDDPSTVIRREAQLLVAYPDSPSSARRDISTTVPAPASGRRTRAGSTGGTRPSRCVCSSYFGVPSTSSFSMPTIRARCSGWTRSALRCGGERARGSLRTYSVLADGVDTACVQLPWVYDRDRAFRAAYGTRGTCAYLVRPDGYVGYRGGSPSREGIEAAPARVLR